MSKPLPIMPVDSPSSDKFSKPYWSAACKTLSARLWLPTANDGHGSGLSLSHGLSSATVHKSWFSARLITPVHPTNFYKTCSPYLASLQPEYTTYANTVTKSRKLRLYPTASQRAILCRWLGASRFVYNRTLDYLKGLDGKRPTWTDLATDIILPGLPEWAKAIPYQIKKMAVKECCDAYTAAKQKYRKTGQYSELYYKSRKSPVQTCYIPKSAVKPTGIYPTLSGVMKYAEPLPVAFSDCELSWQQGRWYLCVPFATTVQPGENQARMVALDPGVRTFQTFFSPDMAGSIGYHDFGRLVRLCRHLDNLIARYSVSKDKKQRYRMRRAADRLRWKIKDLRDELHAKTIRFLVDHFDIILIPTFATSHMVTRARRKLRSKTVRAMLTWAHFKFKERLKVVADQYGKTVLEVNEAYTSKTCSWSGEIVRVGSSECIRGSDGIHMQRDVNGARGIFLRALAELPWLEDLQFALVTNADNLSALSS
jgi:putative transposase